MENDLRILQSNYDVTLVKCISIRSIPSLVKGVLLADVNFVWFGGKVAALTVFLSKVFGKKSLVVAGGADAANVKEINYGALLHPIDKFFVNFAFRYADFVLAVSNFNHMEVLRNTVAHPAKVVTVFNCFDFEKHKPQGEKENLVVTVSGTGWDNLKRKGLDAFVKSAQYLPNVKFALLGWQLDDSVSYLKSIAPPNVEFVGYVPFEKLLRYLQRAKVYVQISYYESFGCALAEAMLCECVPVITSRAALPEVVGNTGYYVPYNNPHQTALAISKALNSEKGKLARTRIMKLFPIAQRQQTIVKTIEGLCDE